MVTNGGTPYPIKAPSKTSGQYSTANRSSYTYHPWRPSRWSYHQSCPHKSSPKGSLSTTSAPYISINQNGHWTIPNDTLRVDHLLQPKLRRSTSSTSWCFTYLPKKKISNLEVRRTMVHTGSSAYIFFYSTFRQMNLKKFDLEPYSSPFVGFDGQPTLAMGKIRLPVFFGSITLMIDFLVVNAASLYNAILGRGWIHKMKADPSTYHQCLWFPTPMG